MQKVKAQLKQEIIPSSENIFIITFQNRIILSPTQVFSGHKYHFQEIIILRKRWDIFFSFDFFLMMLLRK